MCCVFGSDEGRAPSFRPIVLPFIYIFFKKT
uniref:Uncharacterized protein n=1 Tax=Zea mays TaxID=4577 RepID=C4J311_MAIZE|nr:unknown [Zea mays]